MFNRRAAPNDRARLRATDVLTANVMVADASVFPSSIRVNAHFTTMALAEYATGNRDPFAAA